MAAKDVSPEKRLLDIIEGKESAAKTSPLQKGKKQLAPSAFRARLAFFKNKFKFKPAGPGKVNISLKQINLFMQVCVFVLFAALILNIRFDVRDLHKKEKINFSDFTNEVKAEPAVTASLLRPADYYLQKIRARNIFSLAAQELKPKQVFSNEKKAPKESKLQKMAKDLKLVGISWGKDPDAMIENAKTHETYFVKTGSMIEDIQVEAIYRDKVVLHYGTEEVELR